MNLIYVDSHAVEVIKRSALKQFPEECCGFLWGNSNEILFAKEVKNKAIQKMSAFSMSHLDYMDAEEFANLNKISLLGVYHSHPNAPALFSSEDTYYAMPNFFNVIVSVRNNAVNELRCWQLDDEHVVEIKLIIK